MDPRDVALAEVVREAIREAKLTQQDVAEKIGLASTTWKRRMLRPGSFRIFELEDVATATKMQLSQLLERAEKLSRERMAS